MPHLAQRPRAAAFDESRHPRGPGGKWASLDWHQLDRVIEHEFHPVPLDAARVKHPKSGYMVESGISRAVTRPPEGPPHGNESLGPEGPATFTLKDHGDPHKPSYNSLAYMLGKPAGTEPIPHVYRGMSDDEWATAQKRGYIQSDKRGTISPLEGTNAAADPRSAVSYLPAGNSSGVVAKIAVRPEDKWFTIGADEYLRTRQPIPLDRVEHVVQFRKTGKYDELSTTAPVPPAIPARVAAGAVLLVIPDTAAVGPRGFSHGWKFEGVPGAPGGGPAPGSFAHIRSIEALADSIDTDARRAGVSNATTTAAALRNVARHVGMRQIGSAKIHAGVALKAARQERVGGDALRQIRQITASLDKIPKGTLPEVGFGVHRPGKPAPLSLQPHAAGTARRPGGDVLAFRFRHGWLPADGGESTGRPVEADRELAGAARQVVSRIKDEGFGKDAAGAWRPGAQETAGHLENAARALDAGRYAEAVRHLEHAEASQHNAGLVLYKGQHGLLKRARHNAATRPDAGRIAELEKGVFHRTFANPDAPAAAPAVYQVKEHHHNCPADKPYATVGPDGNTIKCHKTPKEAQDLALTLNFPDATPVTPGAAMQVGAAKGGKGKGNAETLRDYWTHGEGAAKIAWGAPGDFDRCVAEVGKYMDNPQGYCAERHHEALGIWPATHAKLDREGKGTVSPKGAALVIPDTGAAAWVSSQHPRVPAGGPGGGEFGSGATGATPTNAAPVQQGMNGQQIRDLQTRLNALGAKLTVDGAFGPKTLAAVRAYQAAHGLKVDGLVGPKTTAALRLKVQKSAAKPKTTPKKTTAKKTSTGTAKKTTTAKLSDKPGSSTTAQHTQINTLVAQRQVPAADAKDMTNPKEQKALAQSEAQALITHLKTLPKKAKGGHGAAVPVSYPHAAALRPAADVMAFQWRHGWVKIGGDTGGGGKRKRLSLIPEGGEGKSLEPGSAAKRYARDARRSAYKPGTAKLAPPPDPHALIPEGPAGDGKGDAAAKAAYTAKWTRLAADIHQTRTALGAHPAAVYAGHAEDSARAEAEDPGSTLKHSTAALDSLAMAATTRGIDSPGMKAAADRLDAHLAAARELDMTRHKLYPGGSIATPGTRANPAAAVLRPGDPLLTLDLRELAVATGPGGWSHGWIRDGTAAAGDLARGLKPHAAAAVKDHLDKAWKAHQAGRHGDAEDHLLAAKNRARYGGTAPHLKAAIAAALSDVVEARRRDMAGLGPSGPLGRHLTRKDSRRLGEVFPGAAQRGRRLARESGGGGPSGPLGRHVSRREARGFAQVAFAAGEDAAPSGLPALVTIPGVDLLAAGTWHLSTGRQTFTRADLANAADAAGCPAVGPPVIKIGHLDPRFAPQPGQDGEPAIGRVTNIRVAENGAKLVGDLAGMPGWLGAIAASAFPRRSVEGKFGFKCQIGHAHPFVLTGLALLGVTPPGVGVLSNLTDIAALYGVTPPATAAPARP